MPVEIFLQNISGIIPLEKGQNIQEIFGAKSVAQEASVVPTLLCRRAVRN